MMIVSGLAAIADPAGSADPTRLVQFMWDAAAFLSSLIAGVFILTRRRMLSGEHSTWHTAPPAVQAVLALQAIYMGTVALSILFGDHVNQRETIAYVISAVVAVVFTINLEREGRRSPPRPPQGRTTAR